MFSFFYAICGLGGLCIRFIFGRHQHQKRTLSLTTNN